MVERNDELWTTDWDALVKRFPMSEQGINGLKELAEIPAELAYLRRSELAQLWQRGFMKRATFIRFMLSLDSWEVLGTLLSLGQADIDALAALQNCLRPSDLVKSSPPKPDRLEKLYGVRFCP